MWDEPNDYAEFRSARSSYDRAADGNHNFNMTLELLHAVIDGHVLTEGQAESAMRSLLAGESTPVLAASFLTALRVRGETVEELTGFARAMRAAALVLP